MRRRISVCRQHSTPCGGLNHINCGPQSRQSERSTDVPGRNRIRQLAQAPKRVGPAFLSPCPEAQPPKILESGNWLSWLERKLLGFAQKHDGGKGDRSPGSGACGVEPD